MNIQDLETDLYNLGITYCKQKYGLSAFKIKKLCPSWTTNSHQEFLARERIRLQIERKKNKWEKEKIRRGLPATHHHIKSQTRLRMKRCAFKALAYQTNYSRHKPKDKVTPFDLWKIAKRQRLICPYTGEKLTRGNISVEHIIPTSKGGLNVPSNILLVDLWANRMKLDKTFSEFKEKVLSIARHFTLSGDSVPA